MTYLRSLALNFLIVFFMNHSMPGIEISSFENVPNVGADIVFSIVVGFLNAAIFPVFVLFSLKPTFLKMAIIAFIISFGAFILATFASIGVKVLTIGGAVGAGLIVFIVSSVSNYLEYKHSYKKE